MNSREIAVEIINQVLYKNAYSNITLNMYLNKYKDMSKEDKSLITEIVYGTLKYKLIIDETLNYYLREGVDSLDKITLSILRISIYQFKYLDKIPDFAIVNEAVNICKKLRGIKESKLVNGVLRNYMRKGEPHLKCESYEEKISYKFSFPQWIIKLYKEQYGEHTMIKILEGSNIRPAVTVRANLLKAQYNEIFDMLCQENYEVEESDVCPEGIIIKHGSSIEKNRLFKEGYITPQDESAMLVAPLMGVKANDRVIDMCSAPGGKTTHLAEIMQNKGEILAFDIHEHKIKLIKENAERLGIDIIKASINDAEHFYEELSCYADCVLVDAPCSGLGIIRKKPEIKWNKAEKQLNELCNLQKTTLQNAARYVKKGGTLIYSTCTLNMKENDGIIDDFIKNNEEYHIEPLYIGKNENILYSNLGTITILPNEYMDGFFICKLKRV
ncbi:16S rRNA (cytosine967-C5)-methyltransferase [Hathewaya proteolytica DSM 3090]|uniref:16S rRNA (cytosine(967)-C(5))-methyltransferase n=1 Tax=Hathewaya proteolytica DSM 3090 TaxID=1121331 RepID=A0A1M6JAK3_9CLOT|nr:16S rRNA (cytosine(967)-C(5))-methyltransferase RsmB [Hathewaya proteolytica]SHJ43683.1 16S rRNA (cytosine967-C5)-methyltransferase [Hathewaya proteolytica DSM 3090]